MFNNNTAKVLKFLHAVERLKDETRHSWTSQGRQESVAEHTWRLSLMLIICAPYFGKKIDLLKALKMALLHDLGEALIGDKHYLEINISNETKKARNLLENQAVQDLSKLLGENGLPIFELWKEFEDGKTREAKIVRILDKLEACIQHNEADISTWTNDEISSIQQYFNDIRADEAFITKLQEIIKKETSNKLKTSHHRK